MEILFDEHATFGPAKVPVRIFDSEPDLYDLHIIDTTSPRPLVINISGTEYLLQLTDTKCYPYKVKVSSLTEIAEVEHGS